MNRSELIHRGWHERSIYATDASMYREVPSGIAAPRDGKNPTHRGGNRQTQRTHFGPMRSSLAGKLWVRGGARFFSAHASTAQSGPTTNRRGCNQDWSWMNSTARRRPRTLFGPDVSTSTHATLGGMIANRSAGSYSLMCGTTDEHVLALDCVLADGPN